MLGGKYEICTTTTTTGSWLSEKQKVPFQLRISYEIDPEYDDKMYMDAAKAENTEKMYTSLRKLHAKSKHLVLTQETNRNSEFQLFEVIYNSESLFY